MRDAFKLLDFDVMMNVADLGKSSKSTVRTIGLQNEGFDESMVLKRDEGMLEEMSGTGGLVGKISKGSNYPKEESGSVPLMDPPMEMEPMDLMPEVKEEEEDDIGIEDLMGEPPLKELKMRRPQQSKTLLEKDVKMTQEQPGSIPNLHWLNKLKAPVDRLTVKIEHSAGA